MYKSIIENKVIMSIKYRLFLDFIIFLNLSNPTSLSVNINKTQPPVLDANANPIAPIYCIKIKDKIRFIASE